ncbi:MAG: hypothetical protein PSV35_04900 [bacterium]|nr:hypothetical protein [bacterium]
MAWPPNRNIPVIVHIDAPPEVLIARLFALVGYIAEEQPHALDTSVKEEIASKSEMIISKRYSAGINSMFWQLSKQAALRLSREQIDLLPEDEKLVVRTASTFVK